MNILFGMALSKTRFIAAGMVLAFFVLPHAAFAATIINPFPNGSAGAQQWTKLGSPYVVSGSVYMRYGSLNVEPGVVVKFETGASLTVHADVPVTAIGTTAEPIYFTSVKDDSVGGDTNGDGAATTPASGDWGYVDLGAGSVNRNLQLEYVKVHYGGSVARSGGVDPTKLPIRIDFITMYPSLVISYPWYNGSPGVAYTLQHIEVAHSPTGALFVVGSNHALTVSQSSFYDTTEYGAYQYAQWTGFQASTGDVSAANNWWGNPSGPQHPTQNPGGTGSAAGGLSIGVVPWLTANPLPDAPPPPPAPTCCSSVMFLPGIESSRLFRPDYAGGTDRLWEPGENQDVKDLYLDINGDGLRDDVYTKVGDVLDETPIGKNIYKSFLGRMDELKTQNKIRDWEPIAYDWRLSLDDILTNGHDIDGRIYYTGLLAATSTPYVTQELRRLARESYTGKVTIVAHSNGGLLAKRLMQVLGPEASELVDKIILVAVPQVGTPQAIAAGLHGYKQEFGYGLVLSSGVARSFASTSPMFYNLLPSTSYYTYVDDPVVSFDGTVPDWQGLYGSTIHSSELLKNFLSDSYGRVDSETGDADQPIQFRSDMYDAAVALHTSLDAWVPPSGVAVTQIAGWGVPTTVKGVVYTEKGTGVKPEPEFTVDGDGTVVVPSALWTSGVNNYWMNLRAYNNDRPLSTVGGLVSFEHSRILETSAVLDFISDLLSEAGRQLSEYVYLSTSGPSSSDSRLRFSLHSPLSIAAYDSQGRFTGILTTTGNVVEGIPGTYYTEFGDAKYIFADSGSPLHIFMDGYDTGTFTLNVDQLTGDDLVASTTFKNLPTTSDTKVEISTVSDLTSLSPLLLDKNGDGTTDVTLQPKLNDVVTLDETPPVTTHTLVGTPGLDGWYMSSVTASLAASDEESGVRATSYSLDAAATTTGTMVMLESEGQHLFGYYSDDNAGNIEDPKYAPVKIDKTAPEAVLGAVVGTKDLLVTGLDNLSLVTVNTVGTTTTIIDQAGHVTKLVFQKTYSGKNLSYAKLLSIKYDDATPVSVSSSFTYLWDSAGRPVSQTVVVDSQFVVQALYDKGKNKTTIVVLKKNKPVQTLSVSRLAIIKLSTNKGGIVYSW